MKLNSILRVGVLVLSELIIDTLLLKELKKNSK